MLCCSSLGRSLNRVNATATSQPSEIRRPAGRTDKWAGRSPIRINAALRSPRRPGIARPRGTPAASPQPAGPTRARPAPPHKHTALTSTVARRLLQDSNTCSGPPEKVPSSAAAAHRSSGLLAPGASASTCPGRSCASLQGAQLIGPPRGRGQPPLACFRAWFFFFYFHQQSSANENLNGSQMYKTYTTHIF